MKADHTARGSSPEPKETIAYVEILKIAHEEGLKSISTELLATPSDHNGGLAIVKAVVEVELGRFEALGDADPTSVEERFIPHLIRVAETRAKARALRDAVNCGIVSLEELDGERPIAPDRSPGSGAHDPPTRTSRYQSRRTAPRGNGDARRQDNGASDLMTEGQRRYLFRLMATRGLVKEAAEETLKDLLRVDTLAETTKLKASELIDRLLKPSAPAAGVGNGAHTAHV
jgi:hypothetical protein